ncbi:DUF5809 family protein [Halopenitus persicus]|uniref:Uncharacterized protein n=1 Tax=Halopenitus persicus TaxID=1048396 RepID=A0A1H3E301_9EURY|nr:DUF5809 family protein [Halopenitus persicus]QHS16475.1 hypothetical protein GWK26_04515 [haloarchaeon 3A1-DGR]SDX73055.1 hypothetical protein SAMN05216564_101264 [Halopenitus persicus]
METRGLIAPETVAEARTRYEEAGPAAQVVVRETAKAMSFDAAEYDERVTGEVVETARDALFASLLEVHVADRDAFDEWLATHDRYADADVELLGSDHVDRVVWHAAPIAESVVAATFHEEAAAAIGTLRRNAFGRIYRDRLRREAGE